MNNQNQPVGPPKNVNGGVDLKNALHSLEDASRNIWLKVMETLIELGLKILHSDEAFIT